MLLIKIAHCPKNILAIGCANGCSEGKVCTMIKRDWPSRSSPNTFRNRQQKVIAHFGRRWQRSLRQRRDKVGAEKWPLL